MDGTGLIKMRDFDVIYERLKRIERIEEQRLIIYPFGEIGAITKSILNVCFHVEEAAIIDNWLCEEKSGGGKRDRVFKDAGLYSVSGHSCVES